MRKTALILAGALMTGPMPAFSLTIEVSDIDVQRCQQGGGCILVSMAEMQAMSDQVDLALEMATKQGRAEGKESCKGSI